MNNADQASMLRASESPKSGIRINVFLSQAGIASRRGADNLIAQGSVRVNNSILTEPGLRIDPSQDTIEVKPKNGTWETLTQREKPTTYIVYKPKGYVTSMKRQGSDPIIASLVPASPRIYPVGRLDRESEGLILMTNDGALAQKLTHPRTHIPKTYRVHCTHPRSYTEDMLKSYLGRIAKGVRIDGKKTLPARITFIKYLRPQMVELEIILREGRNRQIRRMLGTIHVEVVRLIRTGIGSLQQEDLQLKHGEWRVVTYEDIV